MMTPGNTRVAAVVGSDSRNVQALFGVVADELRAAGRRVIGVIAEAHGLPDRTCAAGFLRDIASGGQVSIYLQEAPSHTSCHLDAGGVEAACGRLIPQIADCDLVIISKFGKLEAGGGGLTPAFEAAAEAGKPVLTSVSDLHAAAWRAFAPGAADLSCDEAAIRRWWEAAREPDERAAGWSGAVRS